MCFIYKYQVTVVIKGGIEVDGVSIGGERHVVIWCEGTTYSDQQDVSSC